MNAVAGLAKCLNMVSTAEGVETQQQLEQLQSIGCTEMQGYLFSPPKPASAWTDPAALQLAVPAPRKLEPAAAPALKIVAQQAKRAS